LASSCTCSRRPVSFVASAGSDATIDTCSSISVEIDWSAELARVRAGDVFGPTAAKCVSSHSESKHVVPVFVLVLVLVVSSSSPLSTYIFGVATFQVLVLKRIGSIQSGHARCKRVLQLVGVVHLQIFIAGLSWRPQSIPLPDTCQDIDIDTNIDIDILNNSFNITFSKIWNKSLFLEDTLDDFATFQTITYN
jgi:hypothetical protein